MSVRAAVVKPVRMVVPCYRSNKMIGAKLHISGVVRKGAPPVASLCKRIDGCRVDHGVPVCVVGRTWLRAAMVEKIGAGPPGWRHPGGPPDRRGGGGGGTGRSQPFSVRGLNAAVG